MLFKMIKTLFLLPFFMQVIKNGGMSLAFSYYPQKRSILHSNMNAILKHSLMNMVLDLAMLSLLI